MNLRRLRYFLRAAAEGSISRAAQVDGVAQPAFTRQIQLLEAEIGVQLFERLPRGLRMTETGQFLKDALELPLAEIDAALRSARTFSTHATSSITIGLPPSIPEAFAGGLAARLRTDLPRIALRIVTDDSDRLATALSRRLIDAAILVSVMPEQRVSRVQVLSEPLELVGPPGAEALRDGAVPFARLEGLPLILPPEPSGRRINIDRAAEMAGTKITPVIEVGGDELARQLAMRGHGYAIMPHRSFEGVALAGVPIVDPTPMQPILWAVRPDWRLTRALYNELERVVMTEWHRAVSAGEWQAEWMLDFSVLSLPIRES